MVQDQDLGHAGRSRSAAQRWKTWLRIVRLNQKSREHITFADLNSNDDDSNEAADDLVHCLMVHIVEIYRLGNILNLKIIYTNKSKRHLAVNI